jgi:FtsZ-interacting cell division protein ZipA
MELLETQDPQKRKLIETSDRYKHELQKEVKTITEKTERTMKNALIIGGALALTYVLVSQISSSRKKKSRKKIKAAAIAREVDDDEDEMEEISNEPSLISKVGTQIMNQATAILLELAKEKLSEYLESRKQKQDENS